MTIQLISSCVNRLSEVLWNLGELSFTERSLHTLILDPRKANFFHSWGIIAVSRLPLEAVEK